MPAGVEFAGRVAAVGAGVTNWREGDAVMGHGTGGQAEYVLAAPRALMAVASGVSWIVAAAFPNVFITAHDALVTYDRRFGHPKHTVRQFRGQYILRGRQVFTRGHRSPPQFPSRTRHSHGILTFPPLTTTMPSSRPGFKR